MACLQPVAEKWPVKVDLRDEDWVAIRDHVLQIERLLRDGSDTYAAGRLAGLLVDAENDRGAAVAYLTSGDVWGHMGSLFDRSLRDRGIDLSFLRAQLGLADALGAAGVATPDVRHHASLIRESGAIGLLGG